MSYEISISTFANIAQILVALLSIAAFVPQWGVILRKRQSANISLKSWFLWLASGLLSWFYALAQLLEHQRGAALFLSSSAALVCVVFTIILVWYFRPKTVLQVVKVQKRQCLSGKGCLLKIGNVAWCAEQPGNLRERLVYLRCSP